MFTEEFRDLANRLIATKLTERQEELQEDIEQVRHKAAAHDLPNFDVTYKAIRDL